MIINSIIQVNIGYIPRAGCSKDRKTHHPLCRWCVFLAGGLYHPHHIGKGIEDFNK